MSYSNSLSNRQTPLVLDTSVLINLHACTFGENILSAIPNDIIVPQIVAGELEHETSHKNGGHNFLNKLVIEGKVVIENMTDEEYGMFHKLTSRSPSLGDGEAATIAIAATRNILPTIDEKRGRARASALIRSLEPAWSLDLISHPMVASSLGDQACAEALYLALRDGRMRIPPDSVAYVIGLIGIGRAMECTSLPGYRGLTNHPQNKSSD